VLGDVDHAGVVPLVLFFLDEFEEVVVERQDGPPALSGVSEVVLVG
jgi:hypothetical protein